MADTEDLKKAEQDIRKILESKFGKTFSKQSLNVGIKKDGTNAKHEFDAVSDDGKIVVEIKTHSGKASAGKIKSAYTDVYFLSLFKGAEQKILFLTDKDFCGAFQRISDGKLPDNVSLELLELPEELSVKIKKTLAKCSDEMTENKKASA